MGATNKIKKIMIDKNVKRADLAMATSREPSTLSNMFRRDNMTYATVEEILRVMHCKIVFVDEDTGRVYD